MDMPGDQFLLFDQAPAIQGPVQPAEAPPELAELAAAMPSRLYLGTSSWSFPGWAGLVYRKHHSETALARHGLAAYARHPLLNGVGLDRTHYQPISAAAYAAYREAVPTEFRFLVKAHEACTLTRFPEHPRYGTRAGCDNPLFLDAAYATDEVVGPYLEGLQDRAGVLLFQLAPQELPRQFPERLHRFLDALPKGPRYAVELRNRELLGPPWRQALADAGALHCLNLHPRMPDIATQAKLSGALEGEALVIRWMLYRGLGYDQARQRYAPFSHLVDRDPTARRTVAALAKDALGRGKAVFVVANNKAEGSAPRTLAELAKEIHKLS
ncbi:MAG: DUF72 domain-containing protein [Acidobacteriota bacterium]